MTALQKHAYPPPLTRAQILSRNDLTAPAKAAIAAFEESRMDLIDAILTRESAGLIGVLAAHVAKMAMEIAAETAEIPAFLRKQAD